MSGFGSLVDLDNGLKQNNKPDGHQSSLRKPDLTLRQLQERAAARGEISQPSKPALDPSASNQGDSNLDHRQKIMAAFGSSGNMPLPTPAQITPTVPSQFMKPQARPMTVTEAFGEVAAPAKPLSAFLKEPAPTDTRTQIEAGKTMTVSDAFGSCQNRPAVALLQAQAINR